MAEPLILSPELAPRFQVRQLTRLRWGLIGFEILFALLGLLSEHAVSSWPLIFTLLCIHAASNILLHFLQHIQRSPLRLFTATCLIDLLLLGCLLALSGGSSNGLVALLLLPVAIGSVLLPVARSYLLACLAVAVYTLLLLTDDLSLLSGWVSDQPSPTAADRGHAAHPLFSQHLLQMWWAFVLSAALISWFVSTQAQLIREKAKQLTQLQQQQLQQEQALAIATYAANAAHQLATPIQNMALLAEELEGDKPVMLDMQQQLKRCQSIVSQLRENAHLMPNATQTAEPLLPFLQLSIERWLASRPDITISLNQHSDGSVLEITETVSLSAALFNILDNAADAGAALNQTQLRIDIKQHQGSLSLKIRDYGEGLSAQRLAELGKIPLPSDSGLGLGQFLANITLERLGATIHRSNLAGGGMLTEINFSAEKTA